MKPIETEEEYLELKEVHSKKVKELTDIETTLIRWERTRPEAIARTREMLQNGWDVDENTGEIVPKEGEENSVLALGKFMMENNPNFWE